MDFLKNNYHIISTTLFVLAILIAHVFATPPYIWTKNTISDLGAQGYDRRLIMQVGFISFGLVLSVGILLQGATVRTIPILCYGLCVGLTGFFCTKPFWETPTFSVTQANIHSALAQTAGICFTFGILLQLFFASNNQEKYIHFVFFGLVIGCSASFGLVKDYQGVFQRLLYLVSFIWLVKFYKP